ncbi:MAG: hypothetical protein JXA96_11410 [Sedimentisphaerales bacterium]|nr:hypothetical protein [Sedimentisphaerales bacterium]
MRSIKETENFIKHFQVTPGSDMKSNVLNDAFETQEKYNTQKILAISICKNILRSKLVKFVATVIIFISVILCINQFGGSIDGASTAFARMTQAIKQVPWMHAVYYYEEFPEEGQDSNIETNEWWISYRKKSYAIISAKGSISFCDENLHKRFEYEPDSNTVSIKYWQPDYSSITIKPLSEISPEKYFDSYLSIINDPNANIINYTNKNGKETIGILKTQIDTEDYDKTYQFLMDSSTNLPKIIDVTYYKGRNNKRIRYSTHIEIEYPENGPTNIYDLGVPLNAQVISEQLPDKDVLEIWDRYSTYRKDFYYIVNRYAAVITKSNKRSNTKNSSLLDIGSSVWVEYKDNPMVSKFYYQLGQGMNPSDQPQTVDELPQTFEELLEWSKTVKMYPAYGEKSVFEIWEDSPFSAGTVQKYGWPVDSPEDSTIIRDDYSIKNNLICIEYISAPEKNDYYDRILYYLNPEKDYICERKVITNDNPYKVYFTDVVEYGITDSGKWYPAKIQYQNYENSKQTSESIITIYLRTNVEIPETVYDEKVDLPEYEDDVFVP